MLRPFLLCIFFLMLCVPTQAFALTEADLENMLKAQLPEATLISVIEQSNEVPDIDREKFSALGMSDKVLDVLEKRHAALHGEKRISPLLLPTAKENDNVIFLRQLSESMRLTFISAADETRKRIIVERAAKQAEAGSTDILRLRGAVAQASRQAFEALDICESVAEKMALGNNAPGESALHLCRAHAFYHANLLALAAISFERWLCADGLADDFNDSFKIISSILREGIEIVPNCPERALEKSKKLPDAQSALLKYLVAGSLIVEKKDAEAEAVLEDIETTGDLAVKVKYLKGMLQATGKEKKFRSAAENFRDVLRLADKSSDPLVSSLKHMAELALARIAFENGHRDAAIDFYSRIPASDRHYAEAKSESAWSYFAQKDYRKVLSEIYIFASPTFRRRFHPQIAVQQSLAFLKLCDYPKALAALAFFRSRYFSLLPQAESILKRLNGGEIASAAIRKNFDVLPEALYRALIQNIDFSKAYRKYKLYAESEKRFDAIDFGRYPHIRSYESDLRKQSEKALDNLGIASREALSETVAALKALDVTVSEIELEVQIAGREQLKRCLKQSASGEACDVGVRPEKPSLFIGENLQYWQAGPEFWSDENDRYQSYAASYCGE